MNKHSFKRAYSSAPEPFAQKLEDALARLEPRKAGRAARRTPTRTALIASVVLTLCAGVALAIGAHWGIADFLRRDSTLPPEATEQMAQAARKMAAENLGSAENDIACLTVHEALYDGQSILVSIEVAPRGEAILIPGWWDADEAHTLPNENQIVLAENVYSADDLHLVETASMESLLSYNNIKDGSAYFTQATATPQQQGDSIFYLLAARAQPGAPETLNLSCVLLLQRGGSLAVPFQITRHSETPAARLAVRETPRNAVCALQSAALSRTPLASYLALEFTMAEDDRAQVSDDTTVYCTQRGDYYHLVPDCTGMRGAEATTLAQARDSGKDECPICIKRIPHLRFDVRNAAGESLATDLGYSYQLDGEGLYRAELVLPPNLKGECVLVAMDSTTGETLSEFLCAVEE